MIKKIVYYSIIIILTAGIYSAGGLVIEELKTGNGCPKVMNIPMCMVILVCFIIPFVVHIVKKQHFLYFIFTGLAGSIALSASIMQYLNTAECPKTSSGTPMCYFSLLFFTTLILLKIVDLKLTSKKQTTI